MMDFRLNSYKSDELNRKKLVSEAETLLEHQQRTQKDTLNKILALIVSILTAIISSALLPYLLSETKICPRDFFWIVPAMVIAFLLVYVILIGAIKVYQNVVRSFTAANPNLSYDKLKNLIDKFDISIMGCVNMCICSIDDYRVTTEIGAKKMFELLQIKYYLSKSISTLRGYTVEHLKNILIFNDCSALCVTNSKNSAIQKSTRKIEHYRYKMVIDLLGQSLREYANIVDNESEQYICDVSAELKKEILNLNQDLEIITNYYKDSIT